MRCVASLIAVFVSLAVVPLNAQLPHFKHILVLVQENRSPDNMFQGLCVPPYGDATSCSTKPGPKQYNIQTSKWYDSSNVRGYTDPEPVDFLAPYDMDHSHWGYRMLCNNDFALNSPCKMDGGARVACFGTCPPQAEYHYVDNSAGVLNPYLDIATQYGWANYMFQTNQGPSFPAHLFLFGGTSAPNAADDAAGIYASENTTRGGTAGCIAEETTSVAVIQPPQNESTRVYPCFEYQTLGDFQQNFSWRYYTPSIGFYWTAPTAIAHICQSTGYGGQCVGTEFVNNVDLHPADVLNDIAGCKLRDVSWVIPAAQNSDHADFGAGGGPSWVASVVNAVGASSNCDSGQGYWDDTAIFITWDDWGGWYDHEVPTKLPPPQGDYQYGFRVPLLVVSAYTSPGYIDNQRYDFGSVARFIEQNFGVPEGALGFADARATTDLTAFFNLANGPRVFKKISAPLDANYFINDKSLQGDPDDY